MAAGEDDTLLIGLDAASSRSKFGYAIAPWRAGVAPIEAAGCLEQPGVDRASGMAAIVAAVRAAADRRVLIAIDAPLGWPGAIATALAEHRAGQPIVTGKSLMFRRLTDRLLRETSGGLHRPLEVGADRIARAAHEALSVLDELRARTGLALPLAWSPDFAGAGVIEIYPASTLRSHGLPAASYKKPGDRPRRQAIAARLSQHLPGLDRYVDGSPDRFDACLCLLCACDFLAGACDPPTAEHRALAEREGWIWTRRPA